MAASSINRSSPANTRLTESAQRLRSIGQRATPQRLLILSAFQDASEHLTAEEVLSRVTSSFPAVNRSTVYRTLELFRDLGVIAETDLGGGVRQYQILDQERHHHLVCHDCGAIIDVNDDVLDPVREVVAQRYGFSVEIDHLALFGRCERCVESH